MEITLNSLRKLDPCKPGYEWCHKNFKKGKNDLGEVAMNLNNDSHNDWANWLIVRHMTHDQKVQYAIFAAEQVIEIYEKKYPEDNRPRKAIEAAKGYLKLKTAAAAYAARAAAYAAYAARAARAAADAADAAAAYAARAAAYAAYAADAAYAAYAAADAAYAADAADAAAAYAARAADAAADAAAYAELQIKILKYGLSLIDNQEAQNENI